MVEAGIASRWLLVLGSNCRADQQLATARTALSALGKINATSRALEGADIGGGRQAYLNQLVELQSDVAAEALCTQLKAIERAQGRSAARMAEGICDLDIDLLAQLDSAGVPHWLTDKPQRIPAVRELLQERFGAAARR